MAGIVAHIAIADAIQKRVYIPAPDLFLLGNVAPDGVMKRADYARAMKMHSHLRDGIEDSAFLTAPCQALFHERLDAFIDKYLNSQNANHSFYLGYAAHLITDELFIATVRQEFVDALIPFGVGQRDKKFYDAILYCMNQTDHQLATNYPFRNNVAMQLMTVNPVSFEDYVSNDELVLTCDWILANFFLDHKMNDMLINSLMHITVMPDGVFTYERVLDFINYAVECIIMRLNIK